MIDQQDIQRYRDTGLNRYASSRPGILLLAGFAVAWLAPGAAFSQTETVLYSFDPAGPDGGPNAPLGKLLLNAGNLIGTTFLGGARSHGTLYQLSPQGALTILHDFGSADIGPNSGVTRDAAGNLYGTTQGNRFGDNGSVYRRKPSGKEVSLELTVQGPVQPGGEPLIDLQGQLALTSAIGGAFNDGTVFTVAANGVPTVLYSFTGVGGSLPTPGKLAMDVTGSFYGTTLHSTQTGGSGTIFQVTPTGNHTILYDFTANPSHYFAPNGGLLLDQNGNIYGTAMLGGPLFAVGCVYKLGADGTFTVIHSFQNDGIDGGRPNGGLIEDQAGNLYGTTQAGGSNDAGTVFKVTPQGDETILYSFRQNPDANFPSFGLVMGAAGTLYGVADGGAHNGGAIYQITP